jgi:hypothetical protein
MSIAASSNSHERGLKVAVAFCLLDVWLTFMNLGDAPDDERNLRVEVAG